ncbi:abortive infection system antitoxin AbiGi family protein [Spirosoma validum]|uniref:Uncharacterized protein n=1 Tax=Spirosoma validum TaxID=2771355 RepID=A0A927GDN2_9BACT|nr:abortive infection system antitoxin AbiGi family protein [Spirosoma validum]MBD2753746.1 hypothetical protein [Spirosoma validum]
MPNLSANTLFHFTPRKWLLSIFENGFIPRYSAEFAPEQDKGYFNNFPIVKEFAKGEGGKLIEKDLTGSHQVTHYIPMICFCDIPLTSLVKHMNVYSSFGLGLTKEWAIAKKLNPIMYVNEESDYFGRIAGMLFMLDMTFRMLQEPYSQIENHFPNLHNNANFEKIGTMNIFQGQLFSDLYKYIKTHLKPYQTKNVYRNQPPPYRYYDEKEWRYVPFLPDSEKLPSLIEGILADDKIAALNKQMEKHPLSFTPKDVKYILVEKDSDIEFVVGILNDIRIRTNKFSPEDINQLTTKIMTRTQIEEDF